MPNDLVFIDSKTGLYNNQYFYIRLDEEITRAQRYQHFLSIANIKFLIENNHVKSQSSPIPAKAGNNQPENHSESADFDADFVRLEEFLPQISFLLRRHIRKVDILTRSDYIGFNLILPETSPDGAEILRSRMKQNLEELLWGISKNRNYKVAVGVATYPLDARTDDDLLRKAAPNEPH